MEKKNVEQLDAGVHADTEQAGGAAADVRLETCAAAHPGDLAEGSLLGKFADVEELKKAYECLQAEFTRKCQELAKIKAGAVREDSNSVDAEPRSASPLNDKAGTVQNDSSGGDDSKCPGDALGRATDTAAFDDIIRDYLIAVASKKAAPAVINQPACDFIPASGAEPKALRDAGRLAENFFRTRTKAAPNN